MNAKMGDSADELYADLLEAQYDPDMDRDEQHVEMAISCKRCGRAPQFVLSHYSQTRPSFRYTYAVCSVDMPSVIVGLTQYLRTNMPELQRDLSVRPITYPNY